MNKIKKVLLAVIIPIIILSSGTGVRADYLTDTEICSSDNVKISSRLLELIFGKSTEKADDEKIMLIPGGDVFGARIYQGFLTVCEDVEQAGLKHGDIILAVDGKDVRRMREALGVLEIGNGIHTLTVERDGSCIECKTSGAEQARQICKALRDGVAGIGTVTFINPSDMSFGGLGHGICDDTGAVIPSIEGVVTGVIIGGAVKGEKGRPGELSGILTDKAQGEIISNTPSGVFGKLSAYKPSESTPIEIATRSEVKEGEATIISTVKNGKKAKYTVEIFDVKRDELGTKCFKLRVTDKTLLALTGGIVRGMSGSPIIQDGKLVGAVTHVMVADPTEGYGIFIENMLSAAQQGVQPKAA